MAAVVVMTLLGGQRLRGLAVFGATIVALIPVLGAGVQPPGAEGDPRPARRAHARRDHPRASSWPAACSALLIAAWGLLRLEERARWSDESTQLVWRGLGGDGGGARADRRRSGSRRPRAGRAQFFDDAWHEFTEDEPGQGLRPGADRLVELRQPLGVVEGGRRRVVRQAAAGLGRGLVPGDAPHVPRGRARRRCSRTTCRCSSSPRRGSSARVLGMGALGFLLFARARARARDGRRPRARHRGRAVRRRRRRGSCTGSSTSTGTSPA